MNNVSASTSVLRFILQAVLLLSICVFNESCKNQKKITLNNGRCILDFKNTRTLTSNLKANEFDFDRLKAKLTVETVIDSSSNSFSITLRMKKDSIIWMSISKFGIEGARLLLTKDSVTFVNPLKKQYFNEDFVFLSKFLNTELDFEMIQSLLLGNSVTFYDEIEKIKPGADNCQYTLGTIRKFKLHKVMDKGKELKEPAEIIYLIPETYKIARILFYDFKPERIFDAHYGAFALPEYSTQLFPYRANYTIKAHKNIKIDIEYSKIQLNEDLTFPIKIQDNYERIQAGK